jgi:hypothetical protein
MTYSGKEFRVSSIRPLFSINTLLLLHKIPLLFTSFYFFIFYFFFFQGGAAGPSGPGLGFDLGWIMAGAKALAGLALVGYIATHCLYNGTTVDSVFFFFLRWSHC